MDFTPFSLSPLDHTLSAVYIPHNLCFRTSDQDQVVSRLRAGIDLLVTKVPFFAGEIAPRTDDGAIKGELRIQPGPKALEALPMLTVKRFPGLVLPPALVRGDSTADGAVAASMDAEYFPVPIIMNPTEPRPVLRLQANIVDDGVILSMSLSHSVFDGTGTGTLHELLAECCRAAATGSPASLWVDGEEEAALRNHLRAFGNENTEVDFSDEVGQVFNYGGEEEENEKGEKKEEEGAKVTLLGTGLQTRAFILSVDRLDRLRKACTALLPLLTSMYSKTADGSTAETKWPTFLSSNDIINALVGYGVEKVRGESGIDVSSPSRELTFAINFRKSLPDFPYHYIGNSVWGGRVYFQLPGNEYPDLDPVILEPLQGSGIDAKALLEFANLAFQSRARIIARDYATLRTFLAYLSKRPDYGAINQRLGEVVVTTWRELKVNSLDFGPGLGFVDNFEINVGFSDGMCVVLPETRLDPSATTARKAPFDARVTLAPEMMTRFAQEPLVNWLSERVV